MLTTTPYLHFAGNANEAMNFYKAVFNGSFTIFSRYKDIPGGEKVAPGDQDKLIHCSLNMGNGNILMATDMLGVMEESFVAGNNYHICIHAESEEETETLLYKLSEGGRIEMPPNKTFWGAYFAMCRDKFGIQWMINYTYQQ